MPGAVIVDENRISVHVSADADGAVTVAADPAAGACWKSVQNAAVAGTAPTSVSGRYVFVGGELGLRVEGTVEMGADPATVTVACLDPYRRGAALVATAAGAVVGAEAVVYKAPAECAAEAAAQATVESAPLSVLLNHTMQYSDNTYAEAIFRALGADGAYASAVEGVRAALEAAGYDDAGIPQYKQVDGCGLSRHNFITPSALVRLLELKLVDASFTDLLPLAGETGTLASRFVGTPAQGVVRAKTGSATAVNSLSGVAPLDAGGELVFSVLSLCPLPSSTVRDAIDQVVVLLLEAAESEASAHTRSGGGGVGGGRATATTL